MQRVLYDSFGKYKKKKMAVVIPGLVPIVSIFCTDAI